MAITIPMTIGAFVIWLLKGRKTTLKEEIRCAGLLHYVVGIVVVVIFLLLGMLTISETIE